MRNGRGKWWLAIVVIGCLAPAAFAGQDNGRSRGCEPHQKNCQPVPEGGSPAIYLLGAGLTCIGAMFLRSKMSKPAQS